MRILGIDYGSRRMGVALSDPGARIAFPHGTIHRGGNPFFVDQVASLVMLERVDKIVIGLPLGADGSETETSRAVRMFADELRKKLPLPIEFENEMFSTRMVESAGVKKEQRDESSAALILQSYLDKSSILSVKR